MSTFEIREDFYLDGKPFKIISGAIHYFRVVPEYWEHRLTLLKNMGCNTVETYVAWNEHEAKEGQYDFSGGCDLRKFIQIAASLELKVILRPSPYICAEYEFGGLPAWLLKDRNMRVRSTYQPFMDYVTRYYHELFKEVRDLQITTGGPIILMQVENEFGGYSNDQEYLYQLATLMKENGVTVPLVTSDGPWGDMLENGSIQDIALPTVNCGSKIPEHFKRLEEFQNKKRPLMVMEYWIGWFDAWQDKEHHTTSIGDSVHSLKQILQRGSVNFYMFHGGTNFGFMNGSNYYEKLLPDTTSYDYDAPVNEYGETTEKYLAFKEVIAEYTKITEVPIKPILRINPGVIKIDNSVSLFNTIESISQKVDSTYPLTMEDLDQNYGYVFYTSEIGTARSISDLRLINVADRAQIFINQQWLETKYDLEIEKSMEVELVEKENQLGILVENMGRVNYSVKMDSQRKGISGGVVINGAFQTSWSQYSLDFENIDTIDFSGAVIPMSPTFSRFTFTLDSLGDTFIDMNAWGKGVVIVNGFTIGRYWKEGPQQKLYIPGPKLKLGENEIIIFETEGKSQTTILLTDRPDILNGL
ncbi:glycoside hydrolase family 35 protein [Enterococcus sp. 5H]|uniref:glycoside hydrolase family 35 protein n=1 Tax=Enterococcus sp. 5H TaxID=1229490 RepID=UPI00230373EB|nr:beta-galactosidase family protein [Enterococcus sp. 5H]